MIAHEKSHSSPGPASSACASSAHPWPTATAAPWQAGEEKSLPTENY